MRKNYYNPQARAWCCPSSSRSGANLLGLSMASLCNSFALVLVAYILPTRGRTVGRGVAWNRILTLRHFLLPLRHEGGALEAWVPAESEFAGSDSRSGQLGAKTLGFWGVAVHSARSGENTCTVLGPLVARSPVSDLSLGERVPYSARGGPFLPFPPHCVSCRLGLRITGAIPQ